MGLKTYIEPVDGDTVGRITDHAALDQVLGRLPASHVRARCGLARLVLGTNGGFVIVPGSVDIEPAARLAQRLADETRVCIAEHLPLTPFLGALVSTCTPVRASQSAAVVVAIDLLPDVLVQGPAVIRREVVEGVRDLLESQRLGAWMGEAAGGPGRLELCDPPRPTGSPR